MGRVPLKGWLLLMLGASRAPLNAEEAERMRRGGRKGKGEKGSADPETAGRVVIVPRPENRPAVDPPDDPPEVDPSNPSPGP